MDWFQRWPKDALIAVSNHFLASYDITCTQNVKQAVVNTMGEFQDLVAELCTEYFQRFRRQTHVTPKSYLSFLAGYKTIYGAKKGEIGLLATRMNTGKLNGGTFLPIFQGMRIFPLYFSSDIFQSAQRFLRKFVQMSSAPVCGGMN
jgi:hypothetical protein